MEGSLGHRSDEDGGHHASNDVAQSGLFVGSVVDCEFGGGVEARFQSLEKGVEVALLQNTGLVRDDWVGDVFEPGIGIHDVYRRVMVGGTRVPIGCQKVRSGLPKP